MAEATRSAVWRGIWSLPALALSAVFLLTGSVHTARAGALPFTVNPVTNPGANGPVLSDSRGMTLYVFSRDTNGESNCWGSCSDTWPPLQPSGMTVNGGFDTPTLDPMAAGSLSVIRRPDSSLQVAYNGAPLYLYSGDRNPGDTNGVPYPNPLWAVATPSAPQPTQPPPSVTGPLPPCQPDPVLNIVCR